MGEFLASQQLAPERILSSSARRATETAEIVRQFTSLDEFEVDPRLYQADVETFRQVLAELPRGQRVLIVGHNPELETVLGLITDGTVRLPTAAIAGLRLRSDAMFMTLEALELLHVWRPKEL